MLKELPEGWEWKKLNTLLNSLENGSRPRGGVNQYKEGIPSIGGEHLNSQGGFNFNNLRYIPLDFFLSLKRGVIKDNDIFIVKDGATTGKVSFVNSSFPYKKSAVNEHLFILRTNNQILPKYLFYFLFSSFGQKQILSTYHGAAIGGINTKFIEAVTIPVPPLETQRKIVAILECAEALKQARATANEMTSKIVQAVFLEMFGDPIKNENGYKIKNIGDICRVIRGASPRPKGDPKYFGGNIPWIKISDITKSGKYLTRTSEGVTEEGKKKSVFLKSGTLIISNSATIGLPCFLKIDGCIHDGFLALLDIDKSIHPQYLYYFFDMVRHRLEKLAPSGTQRNLNTGIMRKIPLPIPSYPEQKKFASMVEKVDDMKKRQEKSTEELDELFDSLMQKAFTGELNAKIKISNP